MSIKKALTLLLLLTAPPLCLTPAEAQEEDVFHFIPPGGKSILLEVIDSQPPRDEILAIVTGRRTQQEWQVYLTRKADTIRTLADLTEKELKTLASYLAFNMPVAPGQLQQDLEAIDWKKILPPDGRDIALNNCQFCHIITVSVTQEKAPIGWRGLLGTPSHVVIEISEHEKETLSHYYAINMPIPEEEVPEELRAGGASY